MWKIKETKRVMGYLPIELILFILEYCTDQELLKFRILCKEYNKISNKILYDRLLNDIINTKLKFSRQTTNSLIYLINKNIYIKPLLLNNNNIVKIEIIRIQVTLDHCTKTLKKINESISTKFKHHKKLEDDSSLISVIIL